MATPVLMPKQGNTVEECILVSWRKNKGDSVSSGEVVAEIETDKATFEIEAPDAGTLLETFSEPGDVVPVFTNIAVIGSPGEKVDEFRPAKTQASAATPAAAAPGQAPASPGQSEPAASPATAQPGSAPAGSVSPQPASGVLSPRARKYAARHGLAVVDVVGSGPGGRILEADVKRLRKGRPKLSFAARRALQARERSLPMKGSGINGMVLAAELGEPPAPLSNIRKRIAERMRTSLAETAQFTLQTWADAGGLLGLRSRIKKGKGKPGYTDINLNDMVLFATARALQEFPDVNAEFIDGKIVHHSGVDLAFACDTEKGLMVPVIKNSQRLSLAELASAAKEMTRNAREGRISPDDLSGGSFTVSNVGAMGITGFTPIINYPQTAILGVCAIELKPVRREGEILFVDQIGLSLTADHQVVDGAPAARFLVRMREIIENIESICGNIH